MREKIAEIIGCFNPPSENEASIAVMYSDGACADQILALICEEIGKVENPHAPCFLTDGPFAAGEKQVMRRVVEDFRNKILALLQGKEEK